MPKIYRFIKNFLVVSINFGFSFAFKKLIKSRFEKALIEFDKNNIKHKMVKDYLAKKYSRIIRKYKNKKNYVNTSDHGYSIWVFWWQGIDSMPEIVQCCYKTLCKNASKAGGGGGVEHTVNLITNQNYTQFVNIPKYIIKKVNSNIISITHFSDILRMSLLYEHGGLWLDATILLTAPLPDIPAICYHNGFYSLREDSDSNWNAAENRWAGFAIYANKNNLLVEFVREFFFEYWKDHGMLIDYFLIDYSIAIGYDKIQAIKEMIDAVPGKYQIIELEKQLACPFDEQLFSRICNNTVFHKLTWKINFNKYTQDGHLTFYGYITEKYKN